MKCLAVVVLFIFSFINVNAQSSSGELLDQLVSDIVQPVDYAVHYSQKDDIRMLLDVTRKDIRHEMKKAKHYETYSRIIMNKSYDFAESYSQVFEHDNVPFKTVTAVSAFMGCWSELNYKNPENCWDKHMYKLDQVNYKTIER